MSIISTFELLVKPIAPRGTLPSEFRGVARRVVQGYFLTITNLSNLDLRFRLRFTVSSLNNGPNVSGAAGPSSFGSQVDLLYDIAGAENLPLENVRSAGGGPGFVRLVGDLPSLRGNQTATVQLLPRLTRSVLQNENPELEIRGFADVFIPALITNENGSLTVTPQAQQNVPVLLQPEIRGTFIPDNLSDDSIDFDQINYPLMTASGRAFEEIEPATALVPAPVSPEALDAIVDELRANPSVLGIALNDPTTQLRELVANMLQIEPSAENLTRISNSLNELGIPIVMQPLSR